MLGVSPATVRRASDAGQLACRRSPGGHRRFERAALQGVTRERLLRAGREGGFGEREVLRALADLGEAASRWRDTHELLRDVAGHMLAATGAATCDIYRLEDEGVFRCQVSLDRGGQDEGAVGAVLRVALSPVVGEAFRDGIVYIRGGPRRSPPEQRRSRGLRRIRLSPASFASRCLCRTGWLGSSSSTATGRDAFGAALEYARGAVHVVAGALEKAFLLSALEARTTVLRELFELAQLLSQTYDEEQLLRSVATRLLKAVSAASCDIYQIDGDGYRCVVSASTDGFVESYEGHVLDLPGNPTTAKALAEQCALVVADVDVSEFTAEEREVLLAQDLHSELCIPLVVKGSTVGFIDLFGAHPRDWQECIDFTAGVGQLVAGAMENADLLGRLEERNRDLRTLVEGGLEFGATLDLQRVLLSIARRMRQATSAAACDISALDGDSLHALVGIDGTDEVVRDFAGRDYAVADYRLTGEALRSGRPVVVEDVSSDVRASSLERRSWARSGLRSGIIVPLINGAQIVGRDGALRQRAADLRAAGPAARPEPGRGTGDRQCAFVR